MLTNVESVASDTDQSVTVAAADKRSHSLLGFLIPQRAGVVTPLGDDIICSAHTRRLGRRRLELPRSIWTCRRLLIARPEFKP